ncbi:MAG: HAD-IA family hydrolase [Nanoarchaeota archaeon]|nr:HAD-IA family hydrolase [Nanoarchaeota archaeon]
MIKAIIFDLNDVLVTWHDIDITKEFKKEMGIDIVSFWNVASKHFGDLNLGKFSIDYFYKKALLELGLSSSLSEKARKIQESQYSLINGMVSLLEKLRGGYNLILMAGDNKESLIYKLNKFKLKQHFKKIYCTCFEGIFKDDPTFFRKILSENNLKLDEVLFIDDQERHLVAAREVGIKTILFKNVNQLKEDLKSFGVEV